MAEAPAQLTEEQLAELQRWADRLVAKGADGELGMLARAIASLREEAERARAGRPVADGAELASLRSRAESVVDNGAPEQVRAAARAVLMLCDDIAEQRITRASCARSEDAGRCSSSSVGLPVWAWSRRSPPWRIRRA